MRVFLLGSLPLLSFFFPHHDLLGAQPRRFVVAGEPLFSNCHGRGTLELDLFPSSISTPHQDHRLRAPHHRCCNSPPRYRSKLPCWASGAGGGDASDEPFFASTEQTM